MTTEDIVDKILMSLPVLNRMAADGTPKFRAFNLTLSGDLIYKREPYFNEDPLDINGFDRDPDDSYVFHLRWDACPFRGYTAVIRLKCGCFDVICRCVDPACPAYMKRVSFLDTCKNCPFHIEERHGVR